MLLSVFTILSTGSWSQSNGGEFTHFVNVCECLVLNTQLHISRFGNGWNFDSNAILVEPLKSRKDPELTRAHYSMVFRLWRAVIVPKKHVLNNEVSETMKEVIFKKYNMEMEVVPPGCHRKNAAEVTIYNFKPHILSVLGRNGWRFPTLLAEFASSTSINHSQSSASIQRNTQCLYLPSS